MKYKFHILHRPEINIKIYELNKNSCYYDKFIYTFICLRSFVPKIIVKSATASTEAITELIGRFIPGVIPENEIGELLYYKLPLDMRPKFQNMLIHLEKQQKNLGIVDMRALSSEITEIYMTMSTRKTKQVIISDSMH